MPFVKAVWTVVFTLIFNVFFYVCIFVGSYALLAFIDQHVSGSKPNFVDILFFGSIGGLFCGILFGFADAIKILKDTKHSGS